MRAEPSRIPLPRRPDDQAGRAVAGWRQPVLIDSYLPQPPDRYPAYLDRRVYQGSSGRVYPLPFFERIRADKSPVHWDAVHLENRWIRLMILPELGGRIHIGMDRTNGYDFFYRNEVIKPALIGLTGPWIAGGVEFNWPQHHRPATFLPTDVAIEHADDGSVTVWCSDHDPFTRMKGMHGIRLYPDRAIVELCVRLYNRSDEPQTFLWWANVAARAHEDYQSFFPTDVTVVADHAKRATTAFPSPDSHYYGIDYPARRHEVTVSAAGSRVAGDRIDWYRNIPVPMSYMCLDSRGDFFGGYDHAAQAGFVHVADRQISVGKKQWTWGTAAFGRAWDRNLADDDAAYVELMAGVFTDNQPDFSFIAPGETKVFSQFWYPIQRIGPVQQATTEAAVRLRLDRDERGACSADVGAVSTRVRRGCLLELRGRAGVLARREVDIAPGEPVRWEVPLDPAAAGNDLEVAVIHEGVDLVRWRSPRERSEAAVPAPADEPPLPRDVATVEELYLIGVHLEQYRHATRSPESYWQEALRRDPGHSPTCVALAARAYRRGRYAEAQALLRTAVARLTRRNPNPSDSTAYYCLGLVLRRLGHCDEAYDAFGKASWNRAWRAPAGFQMACIDAAAGRRNAALARLDDVLRAEPDHLQAGALRVIQLRHLGRDTAAADRLRAQLALDPLDWWARDLAGDALTCDAQTCLDVALEYIQIGEYDEALRVLDVAWRREEDLAPGAPAARPLIDYHRARLLSLTGRPAEADDAAQRASRASDRYCFPERLDDVDLLTGIAAERPDDPRPPSLLGHWLYAHGRPDDAMDCWRRAVELDHTDAVAWRNLGLAAYNHRRDLGEAQRCYRRALEVAPEDGRLWFEWDQLSKRAGVGPPERLAALQACRAAIEQRDDATIELVHIHLSLGRTAEAVDLLEGRQFQPWEGGEGQTLGAWDRVCLALAHEALGRGDHTSAVAAVDRALAPPYSLGEQRHPLANSAMLHLLRGDALAAGGDDAEARRAWRNAAEQVGDFLSMSTQPYSEATVASVLAMRRLGRDCTELLKEVAAFCDTLERTPAVIDYFATSLPSLLLFAEDISVTRTRRVEFIRAQLDLVEGRRECATRRVLRILGGDPNHYDAVDLARHFLRVEPVSAQAVQPIRESR